MMGIERQGGRETRHLASHQFGDTLLRSQSRKSWSIRPINLADLTELSALENMKQFHFEKY